MAQAAGNGFSMRGGRQQLHETDAEASEHIFYPQTDVAGTKLSGDEIALVTDAANLKSLVQLASRETRWRRRSGWSSSCARPG
jgi:hypothetical protein